MSNFIFPKEQVKDKAELVLRSAGLQLITPKFMSFPTTGLSQQQQEFELAELESPQKAFGQPIFDNIFIEAVNYIEPQTNQRRSIRQQYLSTALIEVNLPKNIVKTQVQGRNGTVKEYISNDDYQITINGAVISPYPDVPPSQEVQVLRELAEAPVSVQMYSNFLGYFKIVTVVIESFTARQIEGTRNAIGFTMQCVSDEPFEIQYTDNRAVITRSTAFF